MDERTRKNLVMGKRALDFCRAHPDSSPEYIAMVARLEMLLARAEQLELQETPHGTFPSRFRLMDGLNRYRLAEDADSLAEWESASNVVGGGRADGRSEGR